MNTKQKCTKTTKTGTINDWRFERKAMINMKEEFAKDLIESERIMKTFDLTKAYIKTHHKESKDTLTDILKDKYLKTIFDFEMFCDHLVEFSEMGILANGMKKYDPLLFNDNGVRYNYNKQERFNTPTNISKEVSDDPLLNLPMDVTKNEKSKPVKKKQTGFGWKDCEIIIYKDYHIGFKSPNIKDERPQHPSSVGLWSKNSYSALFETIAWFAQHGNPFNPALVIDGNPKEFNISKISSRIRRLNSYLKKRFGMNDNPILRYSRAKVGYPSKLNIRLASKLNDHSESYFDSEDALSKANFDDFQEDPIQAHLRKMSR